MNPEVIEIAGFYIVKLGEKTLRIYMLGNDDVMAIVPISNNTITITKK